MNNLCADVGYQSINHYGEQLCGDHVDVVEQGENSTVIVLADGLGSGVKASILSTLTSKIISTMMSEGLTLEDCVATIAATLPDMLRARRCVFNFYDNTSHKQRNRRTYAVRQPACDTYPRRQNITSITKTELNIGGKKIYNSTIQLQGKRCLYS